MLNLLLVAIFAICVGFIFNEGLWVHASCFAMS